jgi:RNA polymerase sigma-70 factor (ECF subfamily)
MARQPEGSDIRPGVPEGSSVSPNISPNISQGTAAVMEALSIRLRTPLKRYFHNRRVPPDEIEDLLQEVFLRLSARAGVEAIERLDAYVFATASNLLRDRRRQLKSHAASAHEPYDESVHGSARPTSEPDRLLLGTQLVTELVAALYELPERVRTVFSLYHFEDLSHAEIGEQLGIAISTVEKNMARANAHLLTRLGR